MTETYISLRRLENEVISEFFTAGQIIIGDVVGNPIQVSIGQFYGIEINDFAVTVAKTALWIAESQMMKETEDIVHMSLDFLPLEILRQYRGGQRPAAGLGRVSYLSMNWTTSWVIRRLWDFR